MSLQFHLSKYPRLLSEIFVPAHGDFEKGTFWLNSSPEAEGHGLLLWTHGNIYAYVAGPMRVHDLNEKFAEPLHQLMLEGEAEADTLHLPIFRNLTAPHRRLQSRTRNSW